MLQYILERGSGNGNNHEWESVARHLICMDSVTPLHKDQKWCKDVELSGRESWVRRGGRTNEMESEDGSSS